MRFAVESSISFERVEMPLCKPTQSKKLKETENTSVSPNVKAYPYFTIMCERYTLVSSLERLEERWRVSSDDATSFLGNVNITEGDYAPVITCEEPKKLQLFRFGFTPIKAKRDMSIVNARAEGN